MTHQELIDSLRGGLVVSCQASAGHPLSSPDVIGRLALCAELGGAVGVRANSPDNIHAVRTYSRLPVIGLHKVDIGHRRAITPNLELARGLVDAGASIIAVDFNGESPGNPRELVAAIHTELGRPVMADVSTFAEGVAAWEAGVELVGTTLAGYTAEQLPTPDEPDLALVARLAEAGVTVVAEGRYRSPAAVAAAFDQGAWAVVVGTAITDPVAITSRLAGATPREGTP